MTDKEIKKILRKFSHREVLFELTKTIFITLFYSANLLRYVNVKTDMRKNEYRQSKPI